MKDIYFISLALPLKNTKFTIEGKICALEKITLQTFNLHKLIQAF